MATFTIFNEHAYHNSDNWSLLVSQLVGTSVRGLSQPIKNVDFSIKATWYSRYTYLVYASDETGVETYYYNCAI